MNVSFNKQLNLPIGVIAFGDCMFKIKETVLSPSVVLVCQKETDSKNGSLITERSLQFHTDNVMIRQYI